MKKILSLLFVFIFSCQTNKTQKDKSEEDLVQGKIVENQERISDDSDDFDEVNLDGSIALCPITKEKSVILDAFESEKPLSDGSIKYSYSLHNEELNSFISKLSKDSNYNFVVGDDVEKVLNVTIKNQSLLEVIKEITYTGGIDFKVSNNTVFIESLNSMRNIGFNYVYKTKYLSPSNIKLVIPETYKEMLFINDSTSSITISANRSNLINILNIIENIDIKPNSVLLELNIFEVLSKKVYNYGMGFDKTGYGAISGFSPAFNPFGNSILNNNSAKILLSKLDLMEKNGDATVKASPKIIVQDGEKAIFKSTKIKTLNNSFITNSNQIPNINNMQNIKNLIEAGIDLTIIPQIKNDNRILLNISNANSGDFEGLDDSIVRSHSISTKVFVKENQTIILGGMKSKKTVKEKESNTLFNFIPFIRDLFTDTSSKEEDVDLLFTITPKIICN